MANGVLIVAELAADGSLRASSLELVTAARQIAEITGGPISAFVPGTETGPAASALAAVTGSRVLAAPDPRLAPPTAETATTVVARAIAAVEPAVVLVANTTIGAEFAPRLAARLDAGIVADVVAVTAVAGGFSAQRPVLGGRLSAQVTPAAGTLTVLTVRQGAFEKAAPAAAAGSVEMLAVTLEPRDLAVKVVGVSPKPTSTGAGLDTAEIVVAGGRGLKEATNFALVEQLAAALGGAVAATRAVTDAGWRPHNEQIGQTGRVVAPKLYIGAGISGAVQHVVGMQGAENIVAINRDPDAPIFKIANFGIVGDLFEVLPALTEAVKQAKG